MNAALACGDAQVILIALKNAIEACGGVAMVAKEAALSKESIERMLSGKANLGILGISSLFDAIGVVLRACSKQ